MAAARFAALAAVLASAPSAWAGDASFQKAWGSGGTKRGWTLSWNSRASRAAAKEAQAIFLRSLQRSFDLNVVAIVEQRAADEALQRLKIEQARNGRLARTVLQPLSQQGVTVLDDGKRTVTYLPDERLLIERASQRRMLEDAMQRFHLTTKNYELALGEADYVAGRRTIMLLAMPKNREIPARQLFIDEQTLFPLRVVLVGPNGERRVRVDTKAISFPDEVPREAFAVKPLGGARTIRYDEPVPVQEIASAARRCGVEAPGRTQLPFGFRIQGAEVHEHGDCRTLIVRMTDGLALATLYQARHRKMGPTRISHTPGRSELVHHGVSYTLVSDLPQSARTRMLAAFARVKPEELLPPPGSAVPSPAVEGYPPREPQRAPESFEKKEKAWRRIEDPEEDERETERPKETFKNHPGL